MAQSPTFITTSLNKLPQENEWLILSVYNQPVELEIISHNVGKNKNPKIN